MRKPILVLILAVFALGLVGCQKRPVNVGGTNNKEIRVETLFDYDGVRVYRFDDGGHTIYFAKVIGGARVSWDYTTTDGHTTWTEKQSVDTVGP